MKKAFVLFAGFVVVYQASQQSVRPCAGTQPTVVSQTPLITAAPACVFTEEKSVQVPSAFKTRPEAESVAGFLKANGAQNVVVKKK